MFEMSQQMAQQQLLVAGGMTDTIFPAVEELIEETEYQKALEFVARKKNMRRYHSMMDFLFCEIFIAYRHRCFTYYADENGSKPLKDIITEEERARYERWLVAALEIALTKMKEARELTWTRFRAEVLRIAA